MADSDPSTISEDEYWRWFTPAAALTAVDKKTGDFTASMAAILNRAGAGYIRAVAENIDRQEGRKTTKLAPFSRIDPAVFKAWHDNYGHGSLSLWTTGDCNISFGALTMSSPRIDLDYFGIRFDPIGVNKLVGITEVPARSGTEAETKESEGKTGNLAPAALKAWYEAYKLAYGENERTLDHAWDRAKRAFPDKTVTRASVRTLMPGGKPGPKQKD